MKPVIICGGIGSKMWPESRGKSPKHFLPLLNGKSIFELAWETLRKKYSPQDIYLQTNPLQAEIARKLVPEIVEENVFIEPEGRNTGPAIGLTAAMLIKRGKGDEPFILIQADVLREPGEKLIEMIDVIEKFAQSSDKYITAGISPKFVVKGVDYLVKGKLISAEGGTEIYEVADYIDRKEPERIEAYLGAEALLLHANHTVMTPNNYIKMYQEFKPEWYEPLKRIIDGADINQNFLQMPKGPQEEATIPMYKSGRALVTILPFVWNDFGTWESVAKYLETRNEKRETGNEINIDANNNFIRVPAGKMVATIGVENLVIIDSGDAILITTKDKTGRVGEVVDRLKAENRTELL